MRCLHATVTTAAVGERRGTAFASLPAAHGQRETVTRLCAWHQSHVWPSPSLPPAAVLRAPAGPLLRNQCCPAHSFRLQRYFVPLWIRLIVRTLYVVVVSNCIALTTVFSTTGCDRSSQCRDNCTPAASATCTGGLRNAVPQAERARAARSVPECAPSSPACPTMPGFALPLLPR